MHKGFWCTGIDLKDAFLHIPLDPIVWKNFRFQWRDKLYEWRVLPFGLKCSPRILTKMVKPILVFLHDNGISLSVFINQAVCRCRATYEVHVIALVFVCCGWSVNWKKIILDPTQLPIHLGFLWNTIQGTITFPEDKTSHVEAWVCELLQTKQTTHENLKCLVETLVSITPAVWKAPLHYRVLQSALHKSLRFGRDNRKIVHLSHKCIRDLI